MRAEVERWWPLPVAVTAVVVVQQLAYTSRYDVSGHASGHLSSGSFVFLAVVASFVLLWSTPATRRVPLVLAGVAAWLVAGLAIAVGNVRVVDVLIDTGQRDTPTDSIVGSARLDDAHWLADNAPYVALLAAMVIVLGLWRAGLVSTRLAVVCGVLNLLVPPWIVPGLGAVIATVARCIVREREARA
ncbi:MAG: hypothetical protein V7636_789 [Actinomycetota bacterium]|jgi:hypothetical protein